MENRTEVNKIYLIYKTADRSRYLGHGIDIKVMWGAMFVNIPGPFRRV